MGVGEICGSIFALSHIASSYFNSNSFAPSPRHLLDSCSLQSNDTPRHDTIIDLICFVIAVVDLSGVYCYFSHWNDIMLYGEEIGDVFCGSAYADKRWTQQKFFTPDLNSLDLRTADFTDEKIIEFVTSSDKIEDHTHDDYLLGERPEGVSDRTKSYEPILGSHGVACDILGEWKQNPELVLEQKLGKGSPSAELNNEREVEWVACDTCERWHELPSSVSASSLPDKWHCSDNTWDKSDAFCQQKAKKARKGD